MEETDKAHGSSQGAKGRMVRWVRVGILPPHLTTSVSLGQLTTLCLSFLIYKIGLITVYTLLGHFED